MTLPGRIWLPLAVVLTGLAGCTPPPSQQQLAAQAARVQTGQSIIDMQVNTPPAPGAGLSGAEASAIWKHHLADLANPRQGGQSRDRTAGGAAGGLTSGSGGGY